MSSFRHQTWGKTTINWKQSNGEWKRRQKCRNYNLKGKKRYKLCLFSLTEKIERRHGNTRGCSKEEKNNPFPLPLLDRTRSNRLNYSREDLFLKLQKTLMVRLGNRLLGKPLEFPSQLEICKIRVLEKLLPAGRRMY